MKHLILALFLSCLALTADSQCEFTLDAEITSQDVGQYEIVVSDLVQFDLAVDQQVCGVRLFFDHTSLTNLRISLISPDGDQVFLVGPAVVASGITDFTDWDVAFVPCSSPAAPDAGIPDLWSNNSDWNSIDTYVGSYYPSGGCLEDFDSGSANGIWTIEIEDLGTLNSGTLYSAELIFCNDTGLACQVCDAQILNFLSDQQVYCEGAKETLRPANYISQSASDQTVPALILVQNGQIIEIADDLLAIENLTPGIYQIYGAVLIEGSDYSVYNTLQDLESALVGGDVCGDLSTEAIDLNILEVLSTDSFTEVLCREEPFLWEGQVFTAPLDTVLFTFDQSGACSNSVEINLILQDSGLEITESFEVVECGEEIVLSATEIDPSQDYLWTTLDGSIVTGSTTPLVVVNQPGTYYLYGLGDCSPADSIVLPPAGNFDQVSITINSTDCTSPAATLGIETEITLSDFYWLGPDIEGSGDSNPSISQDGDYGLVAFSDDFVCDSIIIYQSYATVTSTASEILKVNDLDCFLRSTPLFVDLGNATVLESKWFNPSGVLVGNGLNIVASQSGVYTLEIAYLSGCSEALTVEVFDSKQTYDLDVEVVLLDCSTQEGLASVITSGPLQAVEWTGPFGFFSEDMTAVLNSFGTYRAVVQYADGCRQAYFFEVDYDPVTSPVVEIATTTIDCNNPKPTLSIASGHDPSYTYNWAGPAGFQSSLMDPQVCNPGNYFVTVTNSDGCQTIYFDLVSSNIGGIEFDILAEVLTCVNFSTDLSISANFSQIASFTWSGPEIDASNENEQFPVVSTPGTYTISGIGANGCEFEESVEVMVNNTPATITNDQATFNIPCIGATSTIEVQADQPIANYEWNIPFEFGPTLTVAETGTYSVTVTNEDFCTSVAEYTVTQNSIVDLNLPPDEISLTCETPAVTVRISLSAPDPSQLSEIVSIETVTTDGTQAASTVTSPSEAEITFTQEGVYLTTLTFADGCAVAESLTVTEAFDPIALELDIPVFDCMSPDGIEVTLTNAQMYTDIEWNNGNMVLGTGATYLHSEAIMPLFVRVIDVNGCESELAVDYLINLDVPDLTVDYMPSADCEQVLGTVEANSSIEVTYEWTTTGGEILSDPTGQSIEIQGNGEYICVVTSVANGCTETMSSIVDSEVGLGTLAMDVVEANCDNNAVVIADISLGDQSITSGGYTLYLDGEVIADLPLSIMDAGDYLITIEDALGCPKDTMLTVTLIPEFTATIDPEYTIEEGESIEVMLDLDSPLDVAMFDIEWPSDALEANGLSAVYQPFVTTNSNVVITDPSGCSQMLDFTINVNETSDVFVPNVFKVGAAGDDGTLLIASPKSTEMEVEIYDRWGNLVYQSRTNEQQLAWDGAIDGSTVEQGVYIVNLQLVLPNGESMRQIYDITIIK